MTAAQRTRLARLHPVWIWLATLVAMVSLSELLGVGLFDGGMGSLLFGLLFLLGAPFIVIGRIAVALTAWGPTWVQMVAAGIAILAATAYADRLLTRWLLREASGETPS